MKYLKILFIFIPVSILCEVLKLGPVFVFFTAALAIIPLAGMLGEATEQMSCHTSARMGGFLNATFGNATELIIAFFALREGLFEVVKASIAGSIIGNILLVLGASMLFGGLKHKVQHFNSNAIEATSSMLLFSVISLSVPAVFLYTVKSELYNTQRYEWLSIGVAISMFIIYLCGLYFSFHTHKDLFGTQHDDVLEAKWSVRTSILVLVISTIFIALESEFLVSAVEPMTKTLGISHFFVGIILIPIIGNAAEHSSAILMAMKNKMDVAVEIAVGSSLQVSLFVAPVLIFISLLSEPMDIIFNVFELSAMLVSVLIANKVCSDGKSNWLEGLQLVALYVIIALSFLVI